MEFRELSDEQWEFIRPLVPPKARADRPRALARCFAWLEGASGG